MTETKVLSINIALVSMLLTLSALASFPDDAKDRDDVDNSDYPAPETIQLRHHENGFRLVIDGEAYSIAREWLIPPGLDEEDTYVSSVNYLDGAVTFPIGNGRLGVRLTSYEIQKQGSAQAAAGRDVFLIFDPEEGAIKPGLLGLGVTRQRRRTGGCWNARSTIFHVADANGDGLSDIAVSREEIRCQGAAAFGMENGNTRPCFRKHPVEWHLFDQGRWVKTDEHFPAALLDNPPLDLPDNLGSPIDFIQQGRALPKRCNSEPY